MIIWVRINLQFWESHVFILEMFLTRVTPIFRLVFIFSIGILVEKKAVSAMASHTTFD